MKTFVVTLLVILFSFCSLKCISQIDSVTVGILQVERFDDDLPMHYYLQRIDSFSSGYLMTNLTREFINGFWENRDLTSNSYSGGNISEIILQHYELSNWTNIKRTIFAYSSVIDSVLYQDWNSQWTDSALDIHIHNNSGIDSVLLRQSWINNSWINSEKNEYAYYSDSSFQSQIISHWDVINLQWIPWKNRFWIHDTAGRDSVLIEQHYDSGIWENVNAQFFTYNINGNLSGTESDYWSISDSSWTGTYNVETYNYDSLNRIIYYLSNDIPGSNGETHYYYDSAGVQFHTYSINSSPGGDETIYDNMIYYFPFPSSQVLYAIAPPDFYVCSNSPSVISGMILGGTAPYSIYWISSGGLNSDTILSPLIETDTNQTLIFTVTDANGITDLDTVTVSVYFPVFLDSIESFSSSCSGCSDGMLILHTSGSFSGYSISPSAGVINGDTISNLPAGIYSVCASNFYCEVCLYDTINSSVSIHEIETDEIRISKNPFSDQTIITLAGPSNAKELYLFDISGRIVRTVPVRGSNTIIDRGELCEGIYFLVINSATIKLIIAN